jgi:hypothetical protein
MPNPGTYLGARLTFLKAQKDAFNSAVADGRTSETLSDIFRRYFKRFPINSEHNVDPDPEWLAAVNDKEADEDPVVPDPDKVSPEEYELAMDALRLRSAMIAARTDVCIFLFAINDFVVFTNVRYSSPVN